MALPKVKSNMAGFALGLKRYSRGVDHLSVFQIEVHTEQLKKDLDNLKASFLAYLESVQDQSITESEQIQQATLEGSYNGLVDKSLDILAQLAEKRPPPLANVPPAAQPHTNMPEANANVKIKLPELKCPTFSGENKDPIEFFQFLTTFANIIGQRTDLTNLVKITYLRNYLQGYALRLISHLTASEESYPEAIEILKQHFHDKEQVVFHLMTKLDTIKPGSQSDLLNAKLYLIDVRCILSDLARNNMDLLSHPPTACLIANKIIRNLPSVLVKEICIMANTNFPTYEQIFKYYEAAILLLDRLGSSSGSGGSLSLSDNTKGKHEKGSFKGQGSKSNNREKGGQGAKIDANNKGENKANSGQARVDDKKRGEGKRACVFDGQATHSSTNCPNYVGVKVRQERARALKRCALCLSAAHLEGVCKYHNEPFPFECGKCNKTSHISPFCGRQ